ATRRADADSPAALRPRGQPAEVRSRVVERLRAVERHPAGADAVRLRLPDRAVPVSQVRGAGLRSHAPDRGQCGGAMMAGDHGTFDNPWPKLGWGVTAVIMVLS